MNSAKVRRLQKALRKFWRGKRNVRPAQMERLAGAPGWESSNRGKHPTWEKGARTLTIPHHGGAGGVMSPYTVEAILEVLEADLVEEEMRLEQCEGIDGQYAEDSEARS